jgi:predicted signal transduction protein with EAL and GGDEF domain
MFAYQPANWTLGAPAGRPSTARCDYSAVFEQADEALYRAKRNGRDQVCLSEPTPVDAFAVPAFA